jgi:hypothetical protein
MGAALLVCVSLAARCRAGSAARAQLRNDTADPHAGHHADRRIRTRATTCRRWRARLRHELAARRDRRCTRFTPMRGGWQADGARQPVRAVLCTSPAIAVPIKAAASTGSWGWRSGRWERGRLQLNGMVSLEPFTIPGCGYPDLLASGEQCDGEAIHDRQHPHDLFMELSARYDAPLGRGLRWELYGGPSGGAGTRSGGVSASPVGDAESAGADSRTTGSMRRTSRLAS